MHSDHDQLIAERAQNLLDLLDLERIEENLYLGQNEERPLRRLFGGQVLSQALVAASRTVEGQLAHSMRAYFLMPGSFERPVLYEVERTRDGRSFTTRRVVAVQEGQPIFSMDVSFQIDEVGFEHAHSMPNVPIAAELSRDVERALEFKDNPRLSSQAGLPGPFEVRSVFEIGTDSWEQNRSHHPSWIRFPQTVEDQTIAQALLAYVSDMGLVGTAGLPHQVEVPRSKLQTASLDHALWIHRYVPMGEWLLLHRRTTMAAGSRGLIHADFYTQTGTLVASVTQEGLLRLRNEA